MAHKKKPGFTLVFGDSFIGPLRLFKHPKWIFVKFKGGTMKGLTKPDNENRKVIENTIAKFDKNDNINAVIFCFGTVDIQFSYYYSKLMNKPFNPDEIINGYVDFIKSVTNPKKYKVGVQLAYPTAIKENNMIYQLEIYHIVDEFYGFPKRDPTIELSDSDREKLIKVYTDLKEKKRPEALKILQDEFAFDKRIQRLNEFNTIFKKKVHGAHLRYIDMCQHLVDSKGYVKPKFIDISAVNVHFRWEPQIPFMLKEFKIYGLTDKFMGSIEDLRAEENKYLKQKEEEQKYIGKGEKSIKKVLSKKKCRKQKCIKKSHVKRSKKRTTNTNKKCKTKKDEYGKENKKSKKD